MAFAEWDDALSVKVAEFDEAHKKLIVMISNLHAAMRQGKGKELVSSLIKEMKTYAQEHFSQEESFMKKYEYSALGAHQEMHKMYIEKVAGFEKDAEAGKFSVTIDLLDFLKHWLVRHIKETDAKYAAELAGKAL